MEHCRCDLDHSVSPYKSLGRSSQLICIGYSFHVDHAAGLPYVTEKVSSSCQTSSSWIAADPVSVFLLIDKLQRGKGKGVHDASDQGDLPAYYARRRKNRVSFPFQTSSPPRSWFLIDRCHLLIPGTTRTKATSFTANPTSTHAGKTSSR